MSYQSLILTFLLAHPSLKHVRDNNPAVRYWYPKVLSPVSRSIHNSSLLNLPPDWIPGVDKTRINNKFDLLIYILTTSDFFYQKTFCAA